MSLIKILRLIMLNLSADKLLRANVLILCCLFFSSKSFFDINNSV
jgi:hypothetical protein